MCRGDHGTQAPTGAWSQERKRPARLATRHTFQLPVIGTISWEETWHTGAAAENPRHAAIYVAFGAILLAATVLVLFSMSPWLQALYRNYSAILLHQFVR